MVDSRKPRVIKGQEAIEFELIDAMRAFYPGAKEELDANLPKSLVPELPVTVYVDSDHAHDKVTRRSISGIIIFLGRTPVFYSSKRQGAIETSTYGAEFCAMRNAIEELISMRYMLRCLGIEVTKPSLVCGDNLGVIQNISMKDSLLKKKHVAISYHKSREAVAAGIAHPVKTEGVYNYADVLTKAQAHKVFCTLIGGILY